MFAVWCLSALWWVSEILGIYMGGIFLMEEYHPFYVM